VATRTGAAGAVRLAELLRDAERTIVLTGAGVSVPSGIPDFRTPGTGLWENVDPMEVAHIDVFRREPDRFWQFYGQRFAILGDKRPNRAHEVLAELERRGLVEAVVTQNIDRLHRAAGSDNVIEVHGSIEWCLCPECGARVALERVMKIISEHPGAPECEACIAPLKPDVVLFGELLPEVAISEAYSLASQADLLLAVGSSLEVYPVASLPRIALDAGASLALVTQGPTPYDDDADVKLSGDVVDEMDAVLAALSPQS
jgi:NAD-dependent deacetylase